MRDENEVELMCWLGLVSKVWAIIPRGNVKQFTFPDHYWKVDLALTSNSFLHANLLTVHTIILHIIILIRRWENFEFVLCTAGRSGANSKGGSGNPKRNPTVHAVLTLRCHKGIRRWQESICGGHGKFILKFCVQTRILCNVHTTELLRKGVGLECGIILLDLNQFGFECILPF